MMYLQSHRSSYSKYQSMGSSASPMLPEKLQNWVPKEIMSIPRQASAADKELLLRKYGITELHWASLTGFTTDAGYLLNRGMWVHQMTLCTYKCGSMEIQGVTPLFLAARSGHASLVRLLLEHGGVDDILKTGAMGDTALHSAALSGSDDVMELLLSALAPTPQQIDKRGYNARTPLHYAAGGGHPAIVAALLRNGANVFAEDENGATPFHFAAGWGNSIRCMELLMGSSREQVHVDTAKDKKGWTALHYAAAHGQVETVEWLLNRGALIEAVDSLHGNTALHLAARHPDVIHALTDKGADIWRLNNNQEDAIGLAHNYKDALAVKAHIKAIQTKTHGEEVDPFAKHGKNGATLLHYVSAYGTVKDMAWISAFQEKFTAATGAAKSKINVKDNAGWTALHWAAITGNVDALHILTKHKADLHKDDGSVLCLAIAYSKAGMDFVHAFLDLPSVKMDIENLVTHKNATQWMKEYYNVHNLQSSMVCKLKKLQKTRAFVQGLIKVYKRHAHCFGWMASTMTSKEQLPATRNAGVDNILDDFPPIYLALNANREDIAQFLQEHLKGSAWQNAVVNAKSVETQRTALHWATIMGDSDMVSKLCRKPLFSEDLMPNMEDKYGKTSVQYAKEMNQAAIEKELMERPDVKNHLDDLHRDRQLYVDNANAVLVVAALIASVTFAGWLQPPLNYVTYYDMPISGAPDGTYASYVAVQQHVGVRVFWVFNSLSFMFAIATVLAGLVAVVPIPRRYISTTVVHLRHTLRVASVMLALSIVSVLGAFAASGFTVLPPILKYQVYMIGSIIAGGIPCIIFLAWFVGILCVASRRGTPPNSPSAQRSPPPPPELPSLSGSRPWDNDIAF